MQVEEKEVMTNDVSTLTIAITNFILSLTGRNVSPHTITAYQTDLRQFVSFLAETDISVTHPDQVTSYHISKYLSFLAGKGLTGVTRARKLASIREFFKYLSDYGTLPSSPAASISMPRKENKSRVFLRSDEYSRLLSAAGSNPRDFCILQLFLQTGMRVMELVSLTLDDIDLAAHTITIHGKGKKERVIDLEKKAIQALKNYRKFRPQVLDPHLFLNYEGQGISDRGVKKLIEKYRALAGIEKKFSTHSLRHTFATYKAEKGVSPFQLQQWLGHTSVTTSQIYVHMSREYARRAMEQTSL